MPRGQQRKRIAAGIWREGESLYAEVRIGSSRNGTQRRAVEPFPLGTKVDTMIAWQHGTRRDLVLAQPAAAVRGSLAADVPGYLASLPDNAYGRESKYLFQHWIDCPIGGMERGAISRIDILGQMSRWIDAGVAVETVNKRLSRLRKFFHATDGLDTSNPTDKIKFLRPPAKEPRDIPTRIIRLILESLPDQGRPERNKTRPTVSVTKIRLRCMAWTGITPKGLSRLKPRDLDLKRARIFLPHRDKGTGARGVWVALVPPAVDAFTDFAAADLFGKPYGKFGKTWRVGIKRATVKAEQHADATGDRSWATELENLPGGCHPYDLRHSFASEVYARTGDIRAVAELLQHASLETTKRYTRGAVSDRVTAAIAKAGATYGAVPKLPAPAPPKPARKLRIVRAS